ncbi:MAG TPA: HAD family hydrolase [Terriglobales bacterium]|nr:HAD family hydrolase [Terriglobales bacterium]
MPRIQAVAFDLGNTLVYEDSVLEPQVRRMPGVLEVLPAISLPMAVWTNTRRERAVEVRRWLSSAGIDKFFSSIVTSVDAGARKPAEAFFHFALARWGRTKDEVLFVCNQLNTDVLGASRCGIRTAWIAAPEFRGPEETLELKDVQPSFVLPDLEALPGLLERLV